VAESHTQPPKHTHPYTEFLFNQLSLQELLYAEPGLPPKHAAGFYRPVVQPTASKHQRKVKVLTPSWENHPVLLSYLDPSDNSERKKTSHPL